jgi:hypothetical protein
MESTMGNVKPLISEQETKNDYKIIEISTVDQLQNAVTDAMISSPQIEGYLDSNRGTYDDKGQYSDIIDKNSKIIYRLRVGTNLAGHEKKGFIMSEYNENLCSKEGKGYNFEGGLFSCKLVERNKYKWIGWVDESSTTGFMLFVDKKNTLQNLQLSL